MVDRGGAESQLSHPRDPCSHELIFRRGQSQIFILQVLPLGSVELTCAHPVLPGSQSGLFVAGEQCWGGAIQRGAQSSCHHCCKKPHVLLCLFREKVESDLIFLGLLILENRLKEETKPVLEELISARIRTVMITGIQQSGNGGS